jgi:hypothetical protein
MMKRLLLLLLLAGLLVCAEIGCGDSTPKIQSNSPASSMTLPLMNPSAGGGQAKPQ